MTSAAAVVGERLAETFRLVWDAPLTARMRGGMVAVLGLGLVIAFASYDPADPSWNAATGLPPENWLGTPGALWADIWLQSLGLAAWPAALLMLYMGLRRAADGDPLRTRVVGRWRALWAALMVLVLAGALSTLPTPAAWPLGKGLGGFWGSALTDGLQGFFGFLHLPGPAVWSGGILTAGALGLSVTDSSVRAGG